MINWFFVFIYAEVTKDYKHLGPGSLDKPVRFGSSAQWACSSVVES